MNIQYFNYIKIATQQVLRATSFQLRKNLMIYSDQSRITTQADKKKTFKKREEEIKNTKIYPGLPFYKGYVQSFAN